MPDANLPLDTAECDIDNDCTGERWVVADIELLAKLVAIIAMGQATQASYILSHLLPAEPAFTLPELKAEAKIRLTVEEPAQTPRSGYPRIQRDGFVFEAISWLAARQAYGPEAYIKEPHVSATSQGLDGLMLELSADRTQIERTTLFEDKCTKDPAGTFRNQVIPAFRERHENKRSAEVISAASALLSQAGVDISAIAQIAAGVTDREKRRYRAAFAITPELDGHEGRKNIFSGYNQIADIEKMQRLGACLVVSPKLRGWFDTLADYAVAYLDDLEGAE